MSSQVIQSAESSNRDLRKFFLKTLLCLIPVLVVLGYAEYKLRQIPNSYNMKKQALEKRLAEIEVLVTGDSHAYSGINPKHWQCHGFNLANVDQDLYFDQQLVNQYLDRMPNLKVVILPISYLTLEFKLQDSPEDWRRFFYSQTYQVASTPTTVWMDYLHPKRHSMIALYTANQTQKYAFQKFQVTDLADAIDANGYIGFDGGNWPIFNDQGGRERMDLHHSLMKPDYVQENIEILNGLIKKLQERKIKVVLMSTPVFQTYSKNMIKEKYDLMQQQLKAVAGSNNIEYFNYQLDTRFTWQDFTDNDHLNNNGAEKLAKLMMQDFLTRHLTQK